MFLHLVKKRDKKTGKIFYKIYLRDEKYEVMNEFETEHVTLNGKEFEYDEMLYTGMFAIGIKDPLGKRETSILIGEAVIKYGREECRQ